MKRRLILSLLIALIFAALLFYLVPLEEIVIDLKKIPKENFILAFLLYTISQITRSFRWRILLRNLSFKEVFLINSANIFLNNVLPARTGELSWFYYARKLGVNLKTSVWSFLVGRLYDLFGLVSLFFITYFLLSDPLLTVPFLFLTVLVFLLIPYLRALIPEKGKLKELRAFLEKEFYPSLSVKLALLSITSFFFKALSLYVLLRGLIEIGMFGFAFAFAGGELTTILPVHGFMGYGTYETGFLLPLKVLGIEIKEGLKAGFIAHNFLLLSSAVWGIISIPLLHTLFRKSP